MTTEKINKKKYSETYVFKLGPKGLKWIMKERKKKFYFHVEKKKINKWKYKGRMPLEIAYGKKITEAHTTKKIQNNEIYEIAK